MKHFYFLCMFFGIICIFSSCSKEEEPMKVEPRILLNKTDSLVMLDVYDKTGGGVYWGKPGTEVIIIPGLMLRRKK